MVKVTPLQDTKYVTYSRIYNIHVHVHCIFVHVQPGTCTTVQCTCTCTLYSSTRLQQPCNNLCMYIVHVTCHIHCILK